MPAQDSESLLERLIRHQVDFVVIGGFAVIAHGVSLLTEDLDVCCPFDEAGIRRVHGAVADLHPVHRITPQKLPFELTPHLLATLKNVYLRTDLGILDCLSNVKGVGEFDAVKQNSVVVELPIGKCRILELATLIRSKEAIGGVKDLQAVRLLKAVQERREQKCSD